MKTISEELKAFSSIEGKLEYIKILEESVNRLQLDGSITEEGKKTFITLAIADAEISCDLDWFEEDVNENILVTLSSSCSEACLERLKNLKKSDGPFLVEVEEHLKEDEYFVWDTLKLKADAQDQLDRRIAEVGEFQK